MNFSSNTILVDSLKKGQEEAYMFLLDTYHRRLHAYALSLIDDYSIADDIVQNVFIVVWEKRKRLKHIASLKKFLYKSVYNEFIDLYRKDVATTALEKKYIEEMDLYHEKTSEKEFNELVNLIKQEIESLPPKCKETFLLSRMEGLSYVEISNYLKVSIKTVETHMSKAFRILREKIGKNNSTILFILTRHPLKIFHT